MKKMVGLAVVLVGLVTPCFAYTNYVAWGHLFFDKAFVVNGGSAMGDRLPVGYIVQHSLHPFIFTNNILEHYSSILWYSYIWNISPI